MRALEYIRISQEDQSTWSIEGQQEYNRRFAEKYGITILETYIDDGRSAKNFNRPEWKRLEKRLQGKHSIDCLIVFKYDRLIRNARDAFNFLHTAENTYGLSIYSSTENFDIDPTSPMFFKFRADLFVNAEFERRVITERTSLGLWRSRDTGRYTHTAPFGYYQKKDETGRNLLRVNQDEADIVQYIYEAFAREVPKAVIKRNALSRGMRRKDNSVIDKILRNPLYTGLVKVPAFKGEDKRMVEGLHEAIIDRELWHQVQELLHQPIKRISVDHHMPLRGFVRCDCCGEVFTGSKSKGKRKHYYYYRCFNCSKMNINAQKVEVRISGILRNLSFRPELAASIEQVLLQEMQNRSQAAEQKVYEISRAIDGLHKKIENLEDKYLDKGTITTEVYNRWSRKYYADITSLRKEQEYWRSDFDEHGNMISNNVHKLTQIDRMYNALPPEDKKELLSIIFGSVLLISNTRTRTPSLDAMFKPKRLKSMELELINKGDFRIEFPEIPLGTPSQTSYEHLFLLFSRAS